MPAPLPTEPGQGEQGAGRLQGGAHGGHAGAGVGGHPDHGHVVEQGPAGLYGGIRVPELATWSSVRYLAHSIAVVDVEPGSAHAPATMTVRGLAKDGSEIDRVTLVRA